MRREEVGVFTYQHDRIQNELEFGSSIYMNLTWIRLNVSLNVIRLNLSSKLQLAALA